MSRGNFFAIDMRTWGLVCDAGDLNQAIAYLVLAQGTGADNRSTSWSVESLKTYAGISFERGKSAIESLCAAGFLRHAETSTRFKPRYELLTHVEIHLIMRALARASKEAKLRKLTSWQRSVFDRVLSGEKPSGRQRAQRDELEFLLRLGLIERSAGSFRITPDPPDPPEPQAEPQLIFLPNELVTGTDRGEDSPVKRLRAAGDIWALRLLVDLYDSHNLRDDGGISPRVIRASYEREGIGAKGLCTIWSFDWQGLSASWSDGPLAPHRARAPGHDEANKLLWTSVSALQYQGLLGFVPHLWTADPTSDGSGAEIVHPYGLHDSVSLQIEIDVAAAAHATAEAMLPDFKVQQGAYAHLAPITRAMPNVQMVGIGRLLYRPKTKRTSQWFSEVNDLCARWIRRYDEIHRDAS